MPIYQVDVVLPSRPETLDLLKVEVRELLMHHEANEFLAQLAITGRWFEQGAHSSWTRLLLKDRTPTRSRMHTDTPNLKEDALRGTSDRAELARQPPRGVRGSVRLGTLSAGDRRIG